MKLKTGFFFFFSCFIYSICFPPPPPRLTNSIPLREMSHLILLPCLRGLVTSSVAPSRDPPTSQPGANQNPEIIFVAFSLLPLSRIYLSVGEMNRKNLKRIRKKES